MSAPIVYRWDDANAPVARGERRSLCDILHACLVTGYGSKPAAGWTREYVNATFDKAAFRNSQTTGTGFYLQVDGASASTANRNKIMAYEAMTSVDNGLFPFAAAVKETTTSNVVGTTARPWIVVADDRFFYFSCWEAAAITPTGPTVTDIQKSEMLFGDIVAHNPADAYACIFGAGVSFGQGFYMGLPAGTVGTMLSMPRKANAVADPFFPVLVRGGGPGSDIVPGMHGMAYTTGDQVLITRPYLNDGAAYTFRGFLPGFYYPCHPLAFGQLAQVQGDGKSYLSIRGYLAGGHYGNYFIDLGDWRA